MPNNILEAPIVADTSDQNFVDRRQVGTAGSPARERRQFTNSYSELSSEAAELASAVDGYKAANRRRFINYEEMLEIISSIGYSKS